MEFYLDLLFDFCRLGDWFIGMYLGLKCLWPRRYDDFCLLWKWYFAFNLKIEHVILDFRIPMASLFQTISI